MWNSQNSDSKSGKRYSHEDISVLVMPLDELLDLATSQPVEDLVDEANLQRLETNELIFAIYQVFDALLSETAVPEGGHIGIHEAIVAELLSKAHEMIICEIDMPEIGHGARQAAWQSIERLLMRGNLTPSGLPPILEELDLDLNSERPFLDKSLSVDIWEELLVDECGLWSEFLWDADWRFHEILDLPQDQAKKLGSDMGLDFNVTQALPHTPSEAETNMARYFLKFLIWKQEADFQE